MTETIEVVGLDHVQLAMPVGQEDAARRFYADILGLTEVEKPAGLAGRGGCWFVGQSTHLHLGVEADFRPATKAHPALLVADLDAARRTLTEAGVRVVDDDSIDVDRFYADDPFGNRIEFVAVGDRGFSDRARRP
ncbi:MAG: VOC family protein [Chloroflexota bacterium]|nr:VOC family protein [Chloroflexota bacterium]